MEDNKDSGTGSFISTLIPLKIKLAIILGLVLFFLIIIVPILIICVLPFNSSNDDEEGISSEGVTSESTSTEIIVVDRDGLYYPKDHYVFCYPVTKFSVITATFGQSGSLWSRKHTRCRFYRIKWCL